MSRLLCCVRARQADMGAAFSHVQDGEACEGVGEPAAPPTMADVIRERKKKAGGAGLGTLRRRLAAAARRPRDARPDRGCEHARYIRATVGSWRVAEVFVLCAELEAAAALRDLTTRAELAREPAPALHADLAAAYRDRWWCDVELVGAGWSLPAHRAVLAARCTYFRDLLQRYPPGCCRVPLEGALAGAARAELDAALRALYRDLRACRHCRKYERSGSDGELDIINVENSSCTCTCRASVSRRMAAALGFSPDDLHRDMKYLLDSGEMSDARLVFRVEGGCGALYGFRAALELPCHRLVLAARSRFFRSVMSRRGGAGGAVCVDEKVLPRRFARALLHAAYTDQVDLSLIGRSSSSPSSTNTSGGTAPWAGVTRGGRPASTALLDDAFQLYEIARFVEMPIVVQGCEDAIVEALSADTLPHILRWAAAPHASQWVHRQAMRYLRDEFPCVMSSPACARLPLGALSAALGSPFLQASEAQALRGALRWAAERAAPARPRRAPPAADRTLGDALAPLLPLVRLEHLPRDHDLLNQLIRRGIVSGPVAGGGTADAWLGRGAFRPARCFLPYLDEIKALLEDQVVPEAEVARVRRERYLHRIPDTLYMVAAARGAGGGGAAAGAGEAACVGGALAAALAARARQLRAAQARALQRHRADPRPAHRQIALRAVREMSLPDSCAELLLADIENDRDHDGQEWESPRLERHPSRSSQQDADQWRDAEGDCCRTLGAGRCAPLSTPATHSAHADNSRTGTCRRETPGRAVDAARHRDSLWGGRLSAAVPDVAMAPNANTHLLASLSSAHYVAHPLAGAPDYGGVVLQLDLGDGATHTPRPGSRAQRASAAASNRQHRDHVQAMSCLRARADDDELRAAIELSVMRAYSSLEGGCGGGGARGRSAPRHELRHTGPSARAGSSPGPPGAPGPPGPPGPTTRDLHTPPRLTVSRAAGVVLADNRLGGVGSSSGGLGSSAGSMASSSGGMGSSSGGMGSSVGGMVSSSGGMGSNAGGIASGLGGLGSSVGGMGSGAGGVGGLGGSSAGGVGGVSDARSPSASPSPRRLQRHDYSLYRHDYRLEPSYGSGSTSRGHSPNYA